MTLITRCDACGKPIQPGDDEAVPRDRNVFVELQASDAPNRRRHYHRTPECWDVVRNGLLVAEQTARQTAG